jgi:hypothetical protein
MTTSTDGILFYGYHLPEDTEWNIEEREELWDDDNPVLVGSHCSDESPMYYVYVQESQTIAPRGLPREVTSLTARYFWDDQLHKFIEKHDLPPPNQEVNEYGGETSGIGWWLASYWG